MTAETIIIIGVALILLGVAGIIVGFLIMVMSKKLDGITRYIKQDVQRYRRRAMKLWRTLRRYWLRHSVTRDELV